MEGNLQYDNISRVQYSDFRNIFHKMTHQDYFNSNKNNKCILQYGTVQYFQNKLRLCTVYLRFMPGLFLTPMYARSKTGICRIFVTSEREIEKERERDIERDGEREREREREKEIEKEIQ